MILAWHRILYRLDWYRFPMCEHAARCRTEEQWINFINKHGEWLPQGGRIPFFMPEWLRKMGVTLVDSTHYDAGTKLDASQ